MSFLPRLRALWSRRKRDADMTAEMQAHVDLQTERNLAAGMERAEARAAAQRQFGNAASLQFTVREQSGALWLDHWQRDLRHALRLPAKARGLAAVIILSLGVGIGVNTVIFSWMRGTVFRPLPGVARASELLLVEPHGEAGSYPGASWPEYRDLRERLTGIEELIAFRMLPVNYGEPGREERVYAQLVSGNYFSALGLRPVLGRALRAEECVRPGTAPVAVISFDFWQRRFGGREDVLGKEIRVNEQRLAVVGVAPANFRGTVLGLSFDLWLPATMAPVLLGGSTELEARDSRGYSLTGRLRADATTAQVAAQLDEAMRALARAYPETNTGFTGEVLPFWRAPRGAARLLLGGLLVLQGFMLLVLLVVCANTANLLLARATARRREIGVRLAIGARPGQILRLLLTESFVLAAAAAVVGIVLALWGTTALRAVPLPGGFPFRIETSLDLPTLGFAVLLGLACALIFGLAPAVKSARTDSQLALRASRPASGRHGGRSVMVSVEVALALLVLVVAAMFLRSLTETRTADPGFQAAGVLLARYDLSGVGYDRNTGRAALDQMLQRIRSAPAVESAAIASWVPLDFHAMPMAEFRFDGIEDRSRTLSYAVTPGYFATMKIPFVAGRDFSGLTARNTGPEAIVNEEFARRFLGAASVLGHRIAGREAPYEIVGVVRNSLAETFGEPPKPVLYFSYRDRYQAAGQIHVRTRGPEAAFAPELRRIVRDVAPAVALYDERTLSEHVDKNLFFRRIPARLFAGLGPLILLLAASGIYAVVSYSVAQRTTEIGVRLALGASPRQVVAGIVRENRRLVWLGLVPAWLLAILVMLHVRGGVLNATVLLGVPLILFLVAQLAAWLPARRAARVDPVVALREE